MRLRSSSFSTPASRRREGRQRRGPIELEDGGEEGRLERLTLRGDEEVEQLERHERVGQVAEELLEQGGELDRVVVRQVDRARVAVERLGEVLEPADVAVLAEDALDRHVCEGEGRQESGRGARERGGEDDDGPICFMAEITSSTKLGMRNEPGPAPCIESAPLRSTRISRGMPNTPGSDEGGKSQSRTVRRRWVGEPRTHPSS